MKDAANGVIDADAIIIGAGPAGACLALNLAPFYRVLLIERQSGQSVTVGESLAPAARRLFRDMGLWESFLAEGHAPCHASRAFWGAELGFEADGLRDPDGPGWHLDRARFDLWLRQQAVGRGAALLQPARALNVGREADGWRVELAIGTNGKTMSATARLLIDAGGRASGLARHFKVERQVQDRLVCSYLHGDDTADRTAGTTFIEAEPDGWWYSAPLPGGRRVIAFHTDADLAADAGVTSVEGLMQRAMAQPHLSQLIENSGFHPGTALGYRAAQSSRLKCFQEKWAPVFCPETRKNQECFQEKWEPVLPAETRGSVLAVSTGSGWMAVGDAALAFDPLSAQGLFNALYTGLAAAEAADRFLQGNTDALIDYQAQLQPIWTAYCDHIHAWYGMERRWPDRPFWQRRHAQLAAHLSAQKERMTAFSR